MEDVEMENREGDDGGKRRFQKNTEGRECERG